MNQVYVLKAYNRMSELEHIVAVFKDLKQADAHKQQLTRLFENKNVFTKEDFLKILDKYDNQYNNYYWKDHIEKIHLRFHIKQYPLLETEL